MAPGNTWFALELEGAAVIGTSGRNLAPATAEQSVVGYKLMCNWSARDHQVQEMQQGPGPAKAKDSGTTFGPALVTVDELERYRRDGRLALELPATVNGEVLTTGHLDDMDWTFGDILAFCSRGVDLQPGEVIGSGTVTGWVPGRASRHRSGYFTQWLRPDDVVSLHGEGLGETRQKIVAGPAVRRLRSGL